MVKTSTPTGMAPGTEVLIPWGLGVLRGVVVEEYGPPARRHVLIELNPDLSGDLFSEATTVSYPLDAIRVAPAVP